MNILDNAKAHFEKIETKVIDVPEWDTQIFCTPMTMNEKKSLWKFAKEDDFEFMVRTLIMKALDSDGNKLFDLSQKPELMNKVSPEVIVRVVSKMSEAVSVEDAEGN